MTSNASRRWRCVRTSLRQPVTLPTSGRTPFRACPPPAPQSIPSRIAKSFPMTEFNRLTILAKELEYRVRGTAYDQRDKVQAQLDEAQA